MKNISLLVAVAAISFIAGAGLTYVAKTPWPSDMANQPSIKPQEWPMLPPQGSIATDMVGGMGASPENMNHPQAGSGMAGHPHDDATAKHDHGSKEKSKEMGDQHETSGASGRQHDSAGAKHDHGAKNVPPMKTKDSQPLPTDLMGSAGTAPGKTLQQGGQVKNQDQRVGHNDHGSKAAPQVPVKAKQEKRTSAPHSHAAGAAHDHGADKAEKTKSKASPAAHKHSPGEAGGHSHAGGDGHGGGDMHSQAQVVNPIRPTETSVKKGHQLFNIYCNVCHGTEGRGGMPMESKIAGIPKFTAELLRGVDDNHMFSMVTSGHGPMPGYAEALTPEERWHVTNYIRTLQIKLAEAKKPATGASR